MWFVFRRSRTLMEVIFLSHFLIPDIWQAQLKIFNPILFTPTIPFFLEIQLFDSLINTIYLSFTPYDVRAVYSLGSRRFRANEKIRD